MKEGLDEEWSERKPRGANLTTCMLLPLAPITPFHYPPYPSSPPVRCCTCAWSTPT